MQSKAITNSFWYIMLPVDMKNMLPLWYPGQSRPLTLQKFPFVASTIQVTSFFFATYGSLCFLLMIPIGTVTRVLKTRLLFSSIPLGCGTAIQVNQSMRAVAPDRNSSGNIRFSQICCIKIDFICSLKEKKTFFLDLNWTELLSSQQWEKQDNPPFHWRSVCKENLYNVLYCHCQISYSKLALSLLYTHLFSVSKDIVTKR